MPESDSQSPSKRTGMWHPTLAHTYIVLCKAGGGKGGGAPREITWSGFSPLSGERGQRAAGRVAMLFPGANTSSYRVRSTLLLVVK